MCYMHTECIVCVMCAKRTYSASHVVGDKIVLCIRSVLCVGYVHTECIVRVACYICKKSVLCV